MRSKDCRSRQPVALGAIVAPPDAAAAAAMLARADIPRRMVSVLKGESLLNDGVALLIFAAAVNIATSGKPATHVIPELAFAVPGGILLGIAIGATLAWMMRWMSGTLSATLLSFVATFGAWILAEQLHLSAILCVVALRHDQSLTIVPTRTPPRERGAHYAVWEAVVFLLNVLAFFLMGLQASEILKPVESRRDLGSLRFRSHRVRRRRGGEIRLGDVVHAHERIRRLSEAWHDNSPAARRTPCSFRGVACADS